MAARRLLPDLRPQLRRRQRRRRRRHGRHRRSGCPTSPTSASTRCGSRRSTPRRSTTTATTSRTTATSTRCSARSPTSTRCSRRAHDLGIRVIVDVVPEPLLDRAPVVPGRARRRPGRPGARALRLPRRHRPRRRQAAEQLGLDLRRPRVDPRRGRPVVPPPLRRQPARPQLVELRDRRRVRRRSCASGWTAASTASGSTWPTGSTSRPRPDAAASGTDKPPHPMWDQPEVHEVYRRWRKILDEYDGDRMAVAEACAGTPEAMARYIREDELQQTFNFAWLEAPWSAAAFRGSSWTPSTPWPGRRHPDLGALQPRRGPRGHPVRRRRVGSRPGAGGRADDDGAAGLGVRLPGRGARPRAGRRAPGAAAGPGVLPRRRAVGRDGCRVPMPWSGTRRRTASARATGSRGSRSRPTGRTSPSRRRPATSAPR